MLLNTLESEVIITQNMEEKKVDTRARNFATVVYPDSAPENWREVLTQEHIAAFVSPLHDMDINPSGEKKKPHYHVMLMFDGKKSKDQVKTIFDKIGGVGFETVQSQRGYARYLKHLDNPEKHQYTDKEVECFGGADYNSVINLPTDRYKAIKEMMTYCKENDIISYSELLEYSAENHYDWFRILCDNGTIVIKEYLKSRTWYTEHYTERRSNEGRNN